MESKVVIVTGASRGIGLAVAQSLLASSQKVVLVSRSADQLQQLKDSFPSQVAFLAADMTAADVSEVHRARNTADLGCSKLGTCRDMQGPMLTFLKTARRVTELATLTFGRIDGVVVNHGVLSPMTRIENASIEEWKKLYDANFFSALALTKQAIPHLRASKGRIVFVSSGAATGAYTAWGAYGSSKAALNSLAKHIAVEEPDITAVAISPGRVDTDMQKELREKGSEMSKKDYDTFVADFEEGRLNKPELPGGVIAKLSLDAKPELSGKYFKWDASDLVEYRQ